MFSSYTCILFYMFIFCELVLLFKFYSLTYVVLSAPVQESEWNVYHWTRKMSTMLLLTLCLIAQLLKYLACMRRQTIVSRLSQ